MVTRAVVVLVVLLSGSARADNPSLDAARLAIDEVRYDDARQLLGAALATGTNDRDALVEIYRLSATTAIVLGQGDLAVQYYRRMLALDPRATPAADVSPKLRTPFVAAQEYMATLGHVEVRAARRGAVIEVTVSDPLGMVAAVTAIAAGAELVRVPYAGRPVVLSHPSTVELIAIVDDHGNRLGTIPGGELGAAIVPHVPARVPPIRRWTTWAVPAAVFTGVGIGFLVEARQSKAQLDDILAHSASHFFGDAEAARERDQRDSVVAGVASAVGGACVVTAIVMALTRPSTVNHVDATLGPGAVAFAIVGTF